MTSLLGGVTGRRPKNSKEKKLLKQKLDKEEQKQLTKFLNTRNSELDSDIKQLRSKMYISPPDGEQPGYGELIHPRGQNSLTRQDFSVTGTSPNNKNHNHTNTFNDLRYQQMLAKFNDDELSFLQRVNDGEEYYNSYSYHS
jgi:hypothetical protein